VFPSIQLIPTAIITHIFTRYVYNYAKSPVFRPLIDRLLGKSIVWAEGDNHKRMCKALNGCLTGVFILYFLFYFRLPLSAVFAFLGFALKRVDD
jgi:hypothetical protein